MGRTPFGHGVLPFLFVNFQLSFSAMNLPAIDQNLCGSWTQININTYNTVPYYLQKATAEFRKDWPTFANLLGKRRWSQNQGPILRTVMTERSPMIRQTAYPQPLTVTPTVDVPVQRERTAETSPLWHDFSSVAFNWYPEFNDFLKHVKNAILDINRQIALYEETFYKTYMWDYAPYVYVVGDTSGEGIVAAPQSTDGTGKTTAWLQSMLNRVGGNGQLTFIEMSNILNKFQQVVGGTPYSGSDVPNKDSSPLTDKYCLVTSEEVYNSWAGDPWVLNNRPLALNILTEGFRGEPLGRFVTKLEKFPRRWAVTGEGATTITEHAPETVQLDSSRFDFGRTYPNPNYANPAVSQYCLSWVVGGNSYETIEVGPPPGDFTSMDPMMNWNGKAQIIKAMMVPCTNADGSTTYEFNERGRYLKAIGTVILGMLGNNAFNVLPVIHKRPLFILPSQTVPNAG